MLSFLPSIGCKAEASGGSESACQTVCRRVGEAEAACAPADCVETCETPLPSCDAENRAYIECLAGAQLLGCLNHSEPTALGECDAQQSDLEACLTSMPGSSSGGPGPMDDGDDETTDGPETSGSDSGDDESGSESGPIGPCDPLDAECVGCGDATCDAPLECCWSDAPACEAAGGCVAAPTAACDGAEDCNGGQCCVDLSVSGTDARVNAGAAVCVGGGTDVSPCCNAMPGVAGCAADPDVQTCVCNFDAYCCEVEWDAKCAVSVGQLGCGLCSGTGCQVRAASTGTGWSIDSVACRTSADCAGVVGEFGVPYGMCCSGTNFGVGACVSETYAYAIMDAGGSCT